MKRTPKKFKKPRQNVLSLYYESVRAVRTNQLATELALTDNYYFKFIFGRSESTSSLQDLLNALLGVVCERQIKSLTLKDPALNPLFYRQKSAILDIVAVDETDRIFNIEMQAYQEKNLPERFLDYVCGLYSRQLKAGESYDQLNPVVGVMLLDDKVWLKVTKEIEGENSNEKYKDRYFDKVRLKSLYTDVVYSDHLTIILIRVPDPRVSVETLVEKTGNRKFAFWLKTLASPNAAYDKELDTFEAEEPGVKDLRENMRGFLAGIGGQYFLRGRQRSGSIWDHAWKDGWEDGWEDGRKEGWKDGRKEGWEDGRKEGSRIGMTKEATNNLLKYLEIRFNKSNAETAPLLNDMTLEDIETSLHFAYACDNYETFVQRAKESQRSGRVA